MLAASIIPAVVGCQTWKCRCQNHNPGAEPQSDGISSEWKSSHIHPTFLLQSEASDSQKRQFPKRVIRATWETGDQRRCVKRRESYLDSHSELHSWRWHLTFMASCIRQEKREDSPLRLGPMRGWIRILRRTFWWDIKGSISFHSDSQNKCFKKGGPLWAPVSYFLSHQGD